MKPSPELQKLTTKVQRANAALTALANGRRHDGKPQTAGADTVLESALRTVIEAGRLADTLGKESLPAWNQQGTGSPRPA